MNAPTTNASVYSRCSQSPTDERAERATALLRKKGGQHLDEVLALATGADDPGLQVAARPAGADPARSPDARRDRGGRDPVARRGPRPSPASTGDLADSTRQRVDLLQAALRFHDHAGDTDCPVCGQGSLDSEWAARDA